MTLRELDERGISLSRSDHWLGRSKDQDPPAIALPGGSNGTLEALAAWKAPKS